MMYLRNYSLPDERRWLEFLSAVQESMERFDRNEIDMWQASKVFEEFENDIDIKIIEFVSNTISEIGGDHDGFIEVLDLVKRRCAPEKFIGYMEEPEPPFLPQLRSLRNTIKKLRK